MHRKHEAGCPPETAIVGSMQSIHLHMLLFRANLVRHSARISPYDPKQHTRNPKCSLCDICLAKRRPKFKRSLDVTVAQSPLSLPLMIARLSTQFTEPKSAR